MRLLICAGGTGGGVYPALAVLQAAGAEAIMADRADSPPVDFSSRSPAQKRLSVLWVGGKGGMEEDLIPEKGIPFEAISAAGIHGVGLKAMPGNLIKLWRGYRQSRNILKRFQPDVLFFTGGYLAAPVAIAGRKIPKLLFVPDIEPGLALKTIAPLADHIATSLEETRKYFPPSRKLSVTGYPVRSEFVRMDQALARNTLNMRPELPTLLVMGGSKGARPINRALMEVLPELISEIQVIHISGHLDWPEIEEKVSHLASSTPELTKRYKAFPYMQQDLGVAYSAADLVLSRAGASVLGEYPRFGLPAILVPYPYGWRYQMVNANYLAQRGAALVVDESELPDKLLPLVRELINDHERLEGMKRSMNSLACPNASSEIFHLLESLAKKRDSRRTKTP